LTGFAITGVRINNLKHEFSIIEGLREDILEILLNLKDIIFVESGDFIGLNFNPIVAALTKAVQELKAELDTLKNK
jgi:DNA-directed RNA polymerase alpha subunit